MTIQKQTLAVVLQVQYGESGSILIPKINCPLILKYLTICFVSYGLVSSGGNMNEFNEPDAQDHVTKGDTDKNIGSNPTGSIG